jgi:outer membrane beta-barrel protein
MKRRFVSALLAAAALAVSLASSHSASAQEIQLTGPLKGAPAVRQLRLYRQGRLELSPTVSFTLLDEYRRTILVGAMVNYAIRDWIAIGAWGAAGVVSTTTDLTDKINATAQADALTANNVNHNGNGTRAPFGDQTARIQYMVAPQLTFIPFRGKLAIFNKIFVDADFYIAAGAAFVGIEERENCSNTSGNLKCSDPASFKRASSTKIAPTFGVGFKFYPGNFWSIGVEYRAVPFAWNRAGFDSRGTGPNGNFPDGQVNSQDDTFKFNQLISVSLGFYLPTSPKLSE